MYIDFFFKIKKKFMFKKLEIIYKIYNFINFRYVILKNKVVINFNKNLIILKTLIFRQKCIISKRTKSSFTFCSLSRFKIKEFLSVGFIPNLKKLS